MDYIEYCEKHRNVLLTGATGFIGSNLVKKLSCAGHNLHIIVRPDSNLAAIEKSITIHTYDGTINSMLNIVAAAKPNLVIHLATLYIAEHASSDIEGLVTSNILLGTELLEAMKQYQVNYLINAGTHWQHYNQECYNPVNLYAATKQAFETIARYYTQTTPMRMLTLKLLDTYGPNDPRPKLFSLLNRLTQTGETLDMSAGQQQLGYVYIDDIVDAFLHALKLINTKPEHYHQDFFVAPEQIYTLRQIVSLYEQTTGIKLKINWGAKPYRNREMMHPYIENKLPQWTAVTSLDNGIKLLLNTK